jgi:hypothetical protein
MRLNPFNMVNRLDARDRLFALVEPSTFDW